MKPREKAEELFYKYCELCADSSYPEAMAKQCALIALDITFEFSDDSFRSCYDYESTEEYLKEVKKEIEKL